MDLRYPAGVVGTRGVHADFIGEPVEGLESPWGSAQVVMIYDSKRTPDPPRSMGALIEWIRSNPGRFTYPAPPDFTGSAPTGSKAWGFEYLDAAVGGVKRHFINLKEIIKL